MAEEIPCPAALLAQLSRGATALCGGQEQREVILKPDGLGSRQMSSQIKWVFLLGKIGSPLGPLNELSLLFLYAVLLLRLLLFER